MLQGHAYLPACLHAQEQREIRERTRRGGKVGRYRTDEDTVQMKIPYRYRHRQIAEQIETRQTAEQTETRERPEQDAGPCAGARPNIAPCLVARAAAKPRS